LAVIKHVMEECKYGYDLQALTLFQSAVPSQQTLRLLSHNEILFTLTFSGSAIPRTVFVTASKNFVLLIITKVF
jgi:hypothetical protein